ncbi:RNA polymerase sigma factor [Candidatus Uabimicrobium amorphum]|uniref:DNA-directed RNA polymerase sigma-70 factor n=1 Tax=Uabimicrobium amorphum TaxID=2596890 RepID=A0A5S9ING7_UABAM|nr:RNA polymerase sigma factor [Candidatus Uabimicrobium amorphum]BBM84562.1 DNA-directed RNA polymerase sigma-70 factor [Candidatus Uabimicrobium amorphum]
MDDFKKKLEENRQMFLSRVEVYRQKLHRYCSRMMGSALDGEDVVQEVLAQAYYRLSQLKQDKPIEPWLFTIAHNKCIDFLRRRKDFVHLHEDMESICDEPDTVEMSDEIKKALRVLVIQLPAMERACVILKDVLDYSLTEIAEIVGTNNGAVKSALHRGRGKLKTVSKDNKKVTPPDSLLSLYAERFNQRDWEGLRELIRQDARLQVVGAAELFQRDQITSGYFTNYQKLEIPWQVTVGKVDGKEVLICWRLEEEKWVTRTAIELKIENGQVVHIKDYIHVDYLLNEAEIESLQP